jgi:hypothetical protein
MDNNFTFSDKITENFIEFRKDGSNLWIEKYFVDPENGKLFAMLLKESFTKMKKKGCKTYMQYVSVEDWENFIKNIPEWKIVSLDNVKKLMLLSCDINCAPVCIMRGFLDNNETVS